MADLSTELGWPKIHVVGDRKHDCPSPVTRADCFSIPNSNMLKTMVLAFLVDREVLRWEETVLDLLSSLSRRAQPFHHQTTLAMLGAHCSGLDSTSLDSSLHSVDSGDLFRYLRQIDGKQGRFAVASSYPQIRAQRTVGASRIQY